MDLGTIIGLISGAVSGNVAGNVMKNTSLGTLGNSSSRFAWWWFRRLIAQYAGRGRRSGSWIC